MGEGVNFRGDSVVDLNLVMSVIVNQYFAAVFAVSVVILVMIRGEWPLNRDRRQGSGPKPANCQCGRENRPDGRGDVPRKSLNRSWVFPVF